MCTEIMYFCCSVVPVSLSDVKGVTDPLSKVEAGLKVEGVKVPLQSVHIRAQLIDLAAKVYRAVLCIRLYSQFIFRLILFHS